MGSSKNDVLQRAMRLLGSALRLVDEGSRSIHVWIGHLASFYRRFGFFEPKFGEGSWEMGTRLLQLILVDVVNDWIPAKEWAECLQKFVFAPRPSGYFVFTTMVNYDDPSHRLMDRVRLHYVHEWITPEDFPVRHQGQVEETFEIVFLDNYSPQQAIKELDRLGLDVPDIASTRAFRRAFPSVCFVSLCGEIRQHDGEDLIAYVAGSMGAMDLTRRRVENNHLQGGGREQFLAVRRRTTTA